MSLSWKKKLLIAVAALICLDLLSRWTFGLMAKRYFEHKCESAAGEFIYETVDDVQGVFQLRLRNPRDFYERMADRDFPEDPYGHTNLEAQTPWAMFLSTYAGVPGYQFFETRKSPEYALQQYDSMQMENTFLVTGERYWRYRKAYKNFADAKHNNVIAEQASDLRSNYGFTWREVRGRWDGLFGVWGSEVTVVQLSPRKKLAVRRGFLQSIPYSRVSGHCPRPRNDRMTRLFVMSVLRPQTHR